MGAVNKLRTGPIRVLLVDDHPVVREGYRRLLGGDPDIHVVAEAGSGEEACALYSSAGMDVVVLDLNMPGIGGLETLHRLRAKDPKARFLVFSMHDSVTMVTKALAAGASGYLTKGCAAEMMKTAIRDVYQGRQYLSPDLAAKMDPTKANTHDPLWMLTRREFTIFRFLSQGYSVQEIAETLSISPKTVGVHQTNIMNKLDCRNGAELTRLAIRAEVIQP